MTAITPGTPILDKVVRPGTTKIGARNARVFCHIHIDAKGELTISGVEGPTHNGGCIGSCGQLGDVQLHETAPGWTPEMLARFGEIWERWHLNHLRAECEHQRVLGWTWSSHPSEPCPTCGYKLGHEWRKEDLPEDVIVFLRALPDSDSTPAWV